MRHNLSIWQSPASDTKHPAVVLLWLHQNHSSRRRKLISETIRNVEGESNRRSCDRDEAVEFLISEIQGHATRNISVTVSYTKKINEKYVVW
jgi:hypothetical protein